MVNRAKRYFLLNGFGNIVITGNCCEQIWQTDRHGSQTAADEDLSLLSILEKWKGWGEQWVLRDYRNY